MVMGLPPGSPAVGPDPLDEIETEASRLVGLLRDRQPGLRTWNGMLAERMQTLRTLIDRALGDESTKEVE